MTMLEINLLTNKDLTNRLLKEQLLKTLCAEAYLVPEFYGNVEPLKTTFRPEQITEIAAQQDKVLLWKRKKPKSEGSLWVAWGALPQHGSVTLSIQVNEAHFNSIRIVFTQIANILEADFGYMHILTDQSMHVGKKNRTVNLLDPRKQIYSLFVTTHELKRYIPDMYWATILGKPYVDLFTKEKILSAPAHQMETLSYGGVLVQSTQHASDLIHNPSLVDATSSRIKQFLNNNAFFDEDAISPHEYNIPSFNLKNSF